ncbi:MAG: MBOAT family O-acyltransferase [Planctomycetota bacterium]
MKFNSIEFLLYFPLVALSYFLLPQRHRWLLLLAASYYFYMCWEPVYALLIVASTVVDYAAGRLMGASADRAQRRKYLFVSMALNLGLLFTFKYLDFTLASLKAAFAPFNLLEDLPLFHLVLPVGISFYTFQTLSYTIDVYRGTAPAERHLGYFALYVVYFPQLVAGPIERTDRLLPQLRATHAFDLQRIYSGALCMLWGFFKKLAIADPLGLIVDPVYNNPQAFEGPAFVVATVAFAIQIYCDFSGYSDIAIGASRILGIELMQNFRRPYLARSLVEFWQRWHISLSQWFRDYVYVPLGGNRGSTARVCVNLFIVFLVSGLWHGASWTFVAWGALHGTYLIVGRLTRAPRAALAAALRLERVPRLHLAAQIATTFTLVLAAWVFFRAASVADACYIFASLGTGWQSFTVSVLEPFANVGVPLDQLVAALIAILCLELVQLAQEYTRLSAWFFQRPVALRWGAYQLLLLGVFLLGDFHERAFIYFQF